MERNLTNIDNIISRIQELNKQHVQVRKLLEDLLILRRKLADLEAKHSEYKKKHTDYLEEMSLLNKRAQETIGKHHEFIKDIDRQFNDFKEDVIETNNERLKKIDELKKIATEQAARISSLEDKSDRIDSLIKKIYTVGLISIVFLVLIILVLGIIIFFITF